MCNERKRRCEKIIERHKKMDCLLNYTENLRRAPVKTIKCEKRCKRVKTVYLEKLK